MISIERTPVFLKFQVKLEEKQIVLKEELEYILNQCKDHSIKPYTLIDVRNPKEVSDTGIIETASNLPLDEIDNCFDMEENDFKSKYNFDKPNKEDIIIFYCMRGRRSAMAIEKFKNKGFQYCINYSGSANEWFNLNM